METTTWRYPKYKGPLIFAVVVHIALLCLLMINNHAAHYRLESSAANAKPVVHAVMISSKHIKPRSQPAPVMDQEEPEPESEPEPQLEQQRMQMEAEAARQAKELAEQQRLQEQQRKEAAQVKALKEQRDKEAEQALAEKKRQQEKIERTQAIEKKRQALAAQQRELQQKLMQQQIAGEQEQLLKNQQFLKTQQMQGVLDEYRGKILAAIGRQWIIPEDADPAISSVFSIDLTPTGAVSHVQLVSSSGNKALDRAAEAAIYKASPLPVPKDPDQFIPFRHFTLKMTPQDVVQ